MILKIGGRTVGDDNPVLIVAELSANHRQNMDIAIETVRAAKHSGADAIKLQTYTPDTLTLDCNSSCFQTGKDTLWGGKTLYQLYTEAYTPWEWHAELKREAESLDLLFFSTPFDRTAVDFLEKIGVPAYKIASFEITDVPLIRYVASKGKPIIISTGIATISEVNEAVEVCRSAGNDQIVLLKCTSAYPTPFAGVNLRGMDCLRDMFQTVVGLSDHTIGSLVPLAATARGASIIEKHFILNRNLGGPDAAFSMEPHEFSAMVQAVQDVQKALGSKDYVVTPEAERSRHFARSLFVVTDIAAGESLTQANVRSIRPADGLHPRHYDEVLGMRAREPITKGTPLSWEMIE